MEFKYLYVIFIFTLISCNQKNQTHTKASNENSTKDTIAQSPLETRKANTHYKPAFEGQTRAVESTTQTAYKTELITDALKSPWGMAVLPDGRLLISENEGYMQIIDLQDTKISEPITGLPQVDNQGQGGLLGICLDPNFSSNRMLYWVYTEKIAKGNHTTVAKGNLADDEKSIENIQVIYRASPTYDGVLHYGGRILFDKEGYLLVSTGERSDKETRHYAQDLNSSLGKILRITTNGQPAPGNPFENQEEALAEIYSYGHRNPQGLDLHPITGELWSNEFGPRGGDELNLIKPGKNYGWPIITYGLEYSGEAIGNPPLQQKEGMEQPVYYWDPVLSASGMTFYKGKRVPEWENNLFLAGLSGSHISRIVIENNKVVGEERFLEEEGERFRDIIQAKEGALYMVTDSGKLYKMDKE